MTASKSNEGTFLFTSESVGEGHPDKIAYVPPQLCVFREKKKKEEKI